MAIPRIVGILLSVIGVAAAVFPDWFAPLTGPASADVFEAVERRVRGGMVLGVGFMFIAVTSLRPWSKSIPMAIFCFMTGALAMRFVGMGLDGAVQKGPARFSPANSRVLARSSLWHARVARRAEAMAVGPRRSGCDGRLRGLAVVEEKVRHLSLDPNVLIYTVNRNPSCTQLQWSHLC